MITDIKSITRFFSFSAILSVLFIACNSGLDEPTLPPDPDPDPEPEPTIVDIPSQWKWSDMICKIYGHNDELANFYETSEQYGHNGDRGICRFINYERLTINQSLSIDFVTDSTLTATLQPGWFDPSLLNGCSKKEKIAVPRIIPVANNLTINFKIFSKEDENNKKYEGLSLPYWFKENTPRLLAHVCDSIGNNISSDIVLHHDSLVFAISHNLTEKGTGERKDFLSKKVRDLYFSAMIPTPPDQDPQKFYRSHNSSKNPDHHRFISISWQSDLFNTVSNGKCTLDDFFQIISGIEFLKKSDYYFGSSDSKYESMDRIMADKHESYIFYDETNYNAPLKTVYNNDLSKRPYRVVLSPQEYECMFFINPDLIFFNSSKYGYYEFNRGEDTRESRMNFFKKFSADKSDMELSPQYTPKQYDWMVDMLSSLSPYTANGLRMKYKIGSYRENSVDKESLTFSLLDTSVAKKFAMAYLSIFENKENSLLAKKQIMESDNIESYKKETICRLIDNLSQILREGENFNVSFNLFRDKEEWELD